MKPRHFGVLFALGGLLCLAACGEDNDLEFTTPTPVGTNTPVRPTNTLPAATNTPVPATSTPIPATNTPQAPTATPTSAPTATATVAVATATPTQTLAPDQVRIGLSHASGAPGSTVQIEVSLQTNGKVVAGTQNDILFDPALVSLAKSTDCKINDAIGDKLPECDEDPQTAPCKQLQRNLADCPGAEGCPQGSEGLKRFRAIILATGNIN